MQVKQIIMAALLSLAIVGPAHAQLVNVKGVGVVQYTGNAATPQAKDEALRKAQVNAIERYYASNGEAESENFDSVRDKVEGSLEQFVLDATTLSEQDQPDFHRYTVSVRAELNVAKLRNTLKASSATVKTAAGQRSTLTFVFLARQVASVKSFDARVYKRADASVSDSSRDTESAVGSEAESVGGTHVSTSATKRKNATNIENVSASVETGGSTTQKADDVQWKLMPSGNFDAAVSGIFAQAGFDVVDVGYLEPQSHGLLSLKALQDDYRTGDDPKPQTLRNTAAGLQAAQVPYLALTTLDVGAKDIDPDTGLMRVYVTVTGKVLDLSGRFPRTVSSVGPVQYAGTGPSQDVAQTNGLKLAADKAARELVNQINVVGVH
ncbi:MAG: hypothetical protein ACRYGG_14835 [Janthinobacterium lividum]